MKPDFFRRGTTLFTALASALGIFTHSGSVLAVEAVAGVELSDLVQTYDGTGKTPTVTTTPPGLPVDWVFTEISPPPSVVYSSIYEPLDLSYQSLSFSAQSTWAIGDLVDLAGTNRDLESVDTVMVTWAEAADYPVLAAANADGWEHPVTITVYSRDAGGNLTSVGEATETIFVPWRPTTLPNGSPYPFNGFAFRISVPFPDGITLPDQAMVLISYNTQSQGFAPIGAPGPYNELNLAMGGYAPSVGTDVDPFTVLWVRGADDWFYPTTGTPDPFLEIKASGPGTPTSTPPVDAGTYQATASVNDPGYVGLASETFIIEPAPVTITLGDLSQLADGSPKPVSVDTTPTGVPVEVLYEGSPTAPSALGQYDVHAAVTDPNYVGTAEEVLTIGYNFASWIQPKVDDSSIPAGEAGTGDDPDLDLILSLFEYAYGLDPSMMDGGPDDEHLPHIEMLPDGGAALVFRWNTLATDLEFDVVTSGELGDGAVWTVTPTVNTVIEDLGDVKVIRAELPPGLLTGERIFAQLRVTQL